MKKILITCLMLLGGLSATNCAAPHPQLETRRFDAQATSSSNPSDEEVEERYRAGFTREGVTWPYGSSTQFDRGQLVVRNTPTNLDRTYNLLRDWGAIPHQWQVAVDVVQFERESVNKLAASGRLDAAALQELWHAGHGTLRFASRLLVNTGVEATTKGNSLTGPPRSFETNDLGAAITVLVEADPEYGHHIMITLDIKAAWGEVVTPSPTDESVFTYEANTSILATDGCPLLLGGGVNVMSGTSTVYAILTVKRLNARGIVL